MNFFYYVSRRSPLTVHYSRPSLGTPMGEASTTVRTAHSDLLKRLDDFDNSKILVVQKMKDGGTTALRESVTEYSPLDASRVFTVLDLTQKPSTKKTKLCETLWGNELKLKLTSTSEKPGQDFLAETLLKRRGLDTSQPRSMFHDPQPMVLDGKKRQTPGVHPFCAQPADNDCCSTSKAGPVLFEIKPAAAADGGTTPNCTRVLAQALGRVFVMRSVYAHLKKIVVFAVTPGSAWVVVFTRNDVHSYKRPSFFERVTVSAIKHKDILPLWRGVKPMPAVLDPRWPPHSPLPPKPGLQPSHVHHAAACRIFVSSVHGELAIHVSLPL
jgi:hypothetical protein